MKPNVVKFTVGDAKVKMTEKSVRNLFLNSLQAHAVNDPAPAQLEWSSTLLDGKSVTYEAAEKAISALGEGWRMPTRRELESIQDLTRHDPCIDAEKFPDTKSSAYWSGTPCAWSPTAAVWVVGFDFGFSDGNPRYYGGACVRAVRSVPSGQ
jgi:hypothetical protein